MPSRRRKDLSIPLHIDSLSSSGEGQGCYGEWKVKIPFTAPGDDVIAQIGRKRSGTFEGRLESVTNPSLKRISPRCLHFAVCGGCRWQHLAYEDQLQEKMSRIAALFPGHPILPILPCSTPYGYRNKMEFSFSSDQKGNRFLGLIQAQGKGKVVDLKECHLPSPWFIETVQAVRAWWETSPYAAYHHYRNTGSLRTLTLREGQRTGERMMILTVSGHPDYAIKKHDLTPLFQEGVSFILRIQQLLKGSPTQFYEIILHGNDHIKEKIDNCTFSISPTAFFQPNTAQAEKLYQAALKMAEINSSSTVYDLYSGTGTLSILAARRAKQVISIELHRQAVLDARQNALNNDCHNLLALEGDVGERLTAILDEKYLPLPDVVMVDPPRAGLLPGAAQQLVRLQAETLLYISCNPVTQAKDIEALFQHGYTIQAIQPVDQFPQTPHIENIVLMKKGTS